MSSRGSNKAKACLVGLVDEDGIKSSVERDSVRASFALIFHTRRGGGALAAITSHRVSHDAGGKAATVLPGNPLSPQDERTILALVRGAPPKSFQVIPEGVLYAQDGTVIWWVPARTAPMALHQAGCPLPKLREVAWPAMVLMVSGDQFYAAAVKQSGRPEAHTPLYLCPVANVYCNTEVCTGDVRLPPGTGVQDVPAWTAVMTDSAFSHDNTGGKALAASNRKGGNRHTDPMKFWSASTHKAFPDNVLVPLGITLADWIEYVTHVRRR